MASPQPATEKVSISSYFASFFSHPAARVLFVLACLGIFAGQMWMSIAGESQTFDEANHIHSGFVSLTSSDYGTNPEHPPLVKLVAAAPLLGMHLKAPAIPNAYFRLVGFIGGYGLLYSDDADKILFRARLAVGVFALALALLVFLAGSEMLGFAAGACALILFIFEPNLLAHGGLVGTDMGVTCCMFAAVYALYRFAKHPSVVRLVLGGIATGLTLGAKHSGILIMPIMLLLIAYEIIFNRQPGRSIWREILIWTGRSAVVAGVGILVLWSLYGFHYRARPGKLDLNPPFAEYVKTLPDPAAENTLETLARWHALPEAYLYGVAAITLDSEEGRPVTFLGTHYTEGQWFYFPVVSLVKSTLAFLCLLLLTAGAWKIWRAWPRRELLDIVAPPVVYFSSCVASKLDLGVRHLLPVYPFFIVLAGAGAAAFLARRRAWAMAACALLILHAGSSLYAYPAYTSYSNEAWGGTNGT
jgi:4-amino-4-deoxy-L-arabinose transferase-like glycosyltransferase